MVNNKDNFKYLFSSLDFTFDFKGFHVKIMKRTQYDFSTGARKKI